MPTHNKELKVGNFPIARLCFSFLPKKLFCKTKEFRIKLAFVLPYFWIKFVSTLRLGLAGAGLYNNNQFSISASLVLCQSPVILPHGRFELSESARLASLIKVSGFRLCFAGRQSGKVLEKFSSGHVGETVCSVVFETHFVRSSARRQACDALSVRRPEFWKEIVAFPKNWNRFRKSLVRDIERLPSIAKISIYEFGRKSTWPLSLPKVIGWELNRLSDDGMNFFRRW